MSVDMSARKPDHVASLQRLFPSAEPAAISQAIDDARRGLRTVGITESRCAGPWTQMVAARLLQLRLGRG